MSFWVCDRLVACEGVCVLGSLFSRLRLFADVSVEGSGATTGDSLAPLAVEAIAVVFRSASRPE